MINKKIGIVIPSINYGGAEKSAILLAEELNKKYRKVDLITLCNSNKKVNYVNYNLISFNKSRVIFSLYSLYRLLKTEKYNSIITGLSHLNFIFIVINFFLNKKNKINLILHYHNIPNINKINFLEKLLNFFIFKLIKFSNYKNIKLVSVSKSIKNNLIQKYNINEEFIFLIYPSINFDLINELKKKKNPFMNTTEKIILSVGRLSKQKNHKLLINSFRKINKLINCKLVIIGDGKLKDNLKKFISKLGLTDKIQIIEKVNNPYPYFYNCDLFVLPSLWEGFGLVLIEAIACKAKIVSTNCPGSPNELLSDYKFAYLSKNKDVNDLSEKIYMMLNNKITNYDFQYEHLQKKFSLNNHINSYINLIDTK